MFDVDSEKDKLRRKKWSLVPKTKEASNKTKKKRRRKKLELINTNPNPLLPGLPCLS